MKSYCWSLCVLRWGVGGTGLVGAADSLSGREGSLLSSIGGLPSVRRDRDDTNVLTVNEALSPGPTL